MICRLFSVCFQLIESGIYSRFWSLGLFPWWILHQRYLALQPIVSIYWFYQCRTTDSTEKQGSIIKSLPLFNEGSVKPDIFSSLSKQPLSILLLHFYCPLQGTVWSFFQSVPQLVSIDSDVNYSITVGSAWQLSWQSSQYGEFFCFFYW